MPVEADVLDAVERDIVLTVKLSGVPVSVINTPYVQHIGTAAGPVARWLLRNRRTKHWMRTFYAVRALRQLKQASLEGSAYRDYWQAGKSGQGRLIVRHVVDPGTSSRSAASLLYCRPQFHRRGAITQ